MNYFYSRLKSLASVSFLVFFFSLNCFSQSDNPVLSMDVEAVPVGTILSVDSLPIITDSTLFEVAMYVNLVDTTSIQEMEVKIGTTLGSSDVFNHTFSFDVVGSSSGGVAFLRDAYLVQLKFGQLMGMVNYYSQIRILRTNNLYSPITYFNR